MQRSCDACGAPYEAARPSSKYCSARCRNRKARNPDLDPEVAAPVKSTRPLVDSVESTLREVDRLGSPIGVRALMLAERMSGSVTDSAYAGLDKQLGAVLAEALEGVAQADPLELLRDELAERRDKRPA